MRHNSKSCFSLPSHFFIWLIKMLCLCYVYFTELKAAAQLSGDAEADPANEATASPMVNPEEQGIVRKKILDSQYKCFEKMNRDLPYNKSGRDNNYWGSLHHPINVLQGIFISAAVCWLCRSLLQSELGWLVVLGRYPGRNIYLPKLPKLFC